MHAQHRARAGRHDPPPNANLRRVEFCAVSGELPTAACTHRVTGWFIPGVSPINQCEIHREILIDDATGLRVNNDDGTRKLHREVYEFWPSDLLALFVELVDLASYYFADEIVIDPAAAAKHLATANPDVGNAIWTS